MSLANGGPLESYLLFTRFAGGPTPKSNGSSTSSEFPDALNELFGPSARRPTSRCTVRTTSAHRFRRKEARPLGLHGQADTRHGELVDQRVICVLWPVVASLPTEPHVRPLISRMRPHRERKTSGRGKWLGPKPATTSLARRCLVDAD